MPRAKKAAAEPAPLAEATPEVAPKKRGRPVGSKNKKSAAKAASATAPAKRGPGRPKGSSNKKSTAKKAPAKRATGRRGRPASGLAGEIDSMIRQLEQMRNEVRQLEQMRAALQNIKQI